MFMSIKVHVVRVLYIITTLHLYVQVEEDHRDLTLHGCTLTQGYACGYVVRKDSIAGNTCRVCNCIELFVAKSFQ